MTQPTSINMTFDTSLVDLSANPNPNPNPTDANLSFSTTESDPSDAGAIPIPIQHIPTLDTYNQWAPIYDTDGNMLQSIDDDELSTLLPSFLDTVLASTNIPSTPRAPPPSKPHILDLGCGTGRNMAKVLQYEAFRGVGGVRVTGMDFSEEMLSVAEGKLGAGDEDEKGSGVRYTLIKTNCFPSIDDTIPNPSPNPSPKPKLPDYLPPITALLSTLVLEHIPLPSFFATLAALLAPGAYALVTNMHAEMGRVSQAGFVNAEGVKVRGESFVYELEDVLGEARRCGFEVLEVRERGVRREDVEGGVVGGRGRKWVGVRVWFGVVLRKMGVE
ncbi:S-adenosyl-L-methionine-dependent methyltransferase [Byssothecium circinans]|uniref:S-adenosyl-L-methionine-dependent methyltransferase n=1 Tax=Byssothecium circinans TaxID=147558 RepID=A0A6A5TC47_9PLEO|nr:S-adenosyl-L-methionine-dependent methyltransferase [Byssothecium circinans]